jgi:hypothetical protein
VPYLTRRYSFAEFCGAGVSRTLEICWLTDTRVGARDDFSPEYAQAAVQAFANTGAARDAEAALAEVEQHRDQAAARVQAERAKLATGSDTASQPQAQRTWERSRRLLDAAKGGAKGATARNLLSNARRSRTMREPDRYAFNRPSASVLRIVRSLTPRYFAAPAIPISRSSAERVNVPAFVVFFLDMQPDSCQLVGELPTGPTGLPASGVRGAQGCRSNSGQCPY